jgi:hypothetical protein
VRLPHDGGERGEHRGWKLHHQLRPIWRRAGNASHRKASGRVPSAPNAAAGAPGAPAAQAPHPASCRASPAARSSRAR